MSVRKIEVDGIGPINFYKKRRIKNIRLSLSAEGDVKVSMPLWVPYRLGVEFLIKNKDWLNKHSKNTLKPIINDDRVGKFHKIVIKKQDVKSFRSRILDEEIKLTIPAIYRVEGPEAQNVIKRACLRSLKVEAEGYLPDRLRELASDFAFSYNSIAIKRLKSRWGSCSQNKDIVLNYFLMQLPWELIDYVILHELVHTKVLAHGKPFWDELDKYLPQSKQYRKLINQHHPVLTTFTEEPA